MPSRLGLDLSLLLAHGVDTSTDRLERIGSDEIQAELTFPETGDNATARLTRSHTLLIRPTHPQNLVRTDEGRSEHVERIGMIQIRGERDRGSPIVLHRLHESDVVGTGNLEIEPVANHEVDDAFLRR